MECKRAKIGKTSFYRVEKEVICQMKPVFPKQLNYINSSVIEWN